MAGMGEENGPKRRRMRRLGPKVSLFYIYSYFTIIECFI